MSRPPSLESPWPNDPLVLRTEYRSTRGQRTAIKRSIGRTDNTHIVREVRVGYIDDLREAGPHDVAPAYSRAEIAGFITRARDEFSVLQAAGIRVPPHEYHVATDSQHRLRTLARLAIVDGPSFGPTTYSELLWQPGAPDEAKNQLLDSIRDYLATRPYDQRLADISPTHLSQFVYGIPRGNQQLLEQPGTYLVDVEPLFYRPL